MLSNKPQPTAVAAPQSAMPAAPPLKPRPSPAPPGAPSTAAKQLWRQPFGPASQLPADRWEANPFRIFFFYCALGALFLRISVLPEVIAYLTNVDTYLLYLVAPPALVGVLLMGGVRRTFRSKAAWLWVAFFIWMILATPFSSWRAGSLETILTYGRTCMIFLLITGGLAITWKDIKATFYAMAAAAFVNLAVSRLFIEDAAGRLTLQASGTIGNSNDLAAHLLLVLPFLFFLSMGRKPVVVRIAVFLMIVYGIWIILGTASRGGLVSLLAVLICIMLRATLTQRLAAGLITLLLGVGFFVILPDRTVSRLGTLVGEHDQEGDESSDARWYLFKKSVVFTVQHPVFGVGPEQFANYEGKASLAQGQHGSWHATHCSLTEVSSECGIPATIFFVAALAVALGAVLKQYRKARRTGFTEVANACFCYLIAMVGFLGSLVFLASAYTFKLPAMIGMAISLSYAAAKQMQMRSPLSPGLAAPPRPSPSLAMSGFAGASPAIRG